MKAGGWDSFSVRLGSFFGAVFLVTGVKVTCLPVWLDWRGLTAAEISLVTAVPLFLRVAATPAIAFVADARGWHRELLIVQSWVALALMGLLGVAHGFPAIFGVTVLLSVLATTMIPLTETIAMAGVRRSGLDYGRMRLWGSLTFIAGSFLAGLGVQQWGPAIVVVMLVLCALIGVAAALRLPRAGVDETGTAPRRGIVPADILRLLLSPRFALFLLAVGAVQSSHAMFYTFGVLHWRAQGHSSVTASLLWAVGVIAEIGLFAASGAVVQRVGAWGLVMAGGAAGVLRWVAMAFDPPLALLVPLQALHGLTYGAAHLGAVHLMSAMVPTEQAGTAQALYASVTSGIIMALATLLVGRLFPTLGGLSYLAMAALSLMGIAAALALRRLGPEVGR